MMPSRHNLSRRAVLGAAAVAPALLAAEAVAPAAAAGAVRGTLPGGAWARALADYGRAEAALASFQCHVERLPPEMRAFPACEPLEKRFDDLECARLASLRRLLRTPAPHLPALALKIDRVIADQAWEFTEAESCLAALKCDARRLAGEG